MAGQDEQYFELKFINLASKKKHERLSQLHPLNENNAENRNSSIAPKITFKKKAQEDTLARENTLPLIQKEFDENRASRYCFLSQDGKFIYHVGIIDYLQDFNFDKMVENRYKSIISDGQKISAVHPKMYCERFFDFMQSQVIINQDLVDV